VKVLLIGGGGREHALAWKFAQEDPHLDLIAAPGNPGIAELGRCVPIAATDIDALVALADHERPALTVVGPEGPLALGVVDRLRAAGHAVFGPTKAAAELESSKVFAKQLMLDAGVPTARAERHTDPAAAKRAARELGAPVVIKASGLAAGKGVIVAESLSDADEAIDAILTRHAFGAAGAEILVEEFMRGEEVSLLFLTDGEQWLPLLPAQDHKRLLDGDAGPNTGGMGAYAPVYPLVVTSGGAPGTAPGRAARADQWADWQSLVGLAGSQIIDPVLEALRHSGRRFSGALYAGLMVTDDGLKVVEFNCRLGDPETQAILPLTRFGLLPLMYSIARGGPLESSDWVGHLRPEHAVATVVAAAGYPDTPRTGDVIHLPPPGPGVHVFQAGTARNAAGELVTAGGRVLAVTAVAADLATAQRASVGYAEAIEFSGKQFRSDIAWRELARGARAS
jgi:phosphoribosylamine--glycine ligase